MQTRFWYWSRAVLLRQVLMMSCWRDRGPIITCGFCNSSRKKVRQLRRTLYKDQVPRLKHYKAGIKKGAETAPFLFLSKVQVYLIISHLFFQKTDCRNHHPYQAGTCYFPDRYNRRVPGLLTSEYPSLLSKVRCR